MQLATWGTYRFKADAQKCADEIMEICEELESATPQQILEKARDGNTELHKHWKERNRHYQSIIG